MLVIGGRVGCVLYISVCLVEGLVGFGSCLEGRFFFIYTEYLGGWGS